MHHTLTHINAHTQPTFIARNSIHDASNSTYTPDHWIDRNNKEL